MPPGTARRFVLALDAGWFEGFVVRAEAGLFGYVDRCPHAGFALTRVPDVYLSADGSYIACSWHGARFDIATGVCIAGPCGGQRLERWPVTVVDGRIVTG
jgi:nitrite reductase/ring-hydroxylating ferredoxin subunit